jgi:hypothetical protein
VVEVDQTATATTYVSQTELGATLSDPGAAATLNVTVRNPTSQQESNTVTFDFTDTGGE